MLWQSSYHEVRGYRLQDLSRITHPAKENYYALAISIIKGYTVEYSLSKMGVQIKPRAYKRKKLARYQEIATIAYIIHTICGFGYNDTSKLLNRSWSQVRDAIAFAQGKKRVRYKNNRMQDRYQPIERRENDDEEV